MDWRNSIRTVMDFPQAGIQFRDITPLLEQPVYFNAMLDALVQQYATTPLDKIVAIEARGFIIGAALASRLGLGLVLARKPGKLPAACLSEPYMLEYGEGVLQMHADAIQADERILLVDDLIATGGTALAATRLVRRLGGQLAHAAFVIDLPDLGGMQQLQQQAIQTFALCQFDGH